MNLNQFNNGGQHFDPMEAGSHPAVCVGVVDIGTHTETWDGKDLTRSQLILMFDFPTETIEINGEHKPRCMSLKLTKSTHKQAKLLRHLISWRGRGFTADELNDFSLTKLLGVSAMVNVIQKTVNGKAYSNISTICKPPKGMAMPTSDRKIYFDMADAETYGAIEELPDWIVKEINTSAEAIATGHVFMKSNTKAHVAQMGGEAVDGGDDVAF